MEIHGQFRSYNRHEEKTQPACAFSICREVKFVEEEDEKTVNQIFWTDISVNRRYTVKLRWEEKLRIFCWQSTDRMENQITYHASAGEEMPAMLLPLKWAVMS